MQSIRCAICKEKEKLVELYKESFSSKKIDEKTFSARRIPDRTHYRFVKCLCCGLIFSNPILPPNKIHLLYKKSDFSYKTESDYLKKTYMDYLKKALGKKEVKGLSLLDIGCGNGFFLEAAKKAGIKDVWGVEPGKASVDKAQPWVRKKIKVNVLKFGLFGKKKFDIITCFHTLDHVVDLDPFLSETYKLLKKGGTAFFIVHDTDGLSVKLFGEKSAIFDIEHIYLFNKKTLSKIFSINKFKSIKVINIINRYPLAYWVRMTPLPNMLREIVLKALKITSIQNCPISIKAGNIGIFAKK